MEPIPFVKSAVGAHHSLINFWFIYCCCYPSSGVIIAVRVPIVCNATRTQIKAAIQVYNRPRVNLEQWKPSRRLPKYKRYPYSLSKVMNPDFQFL